MKCRQCHIDTLPRAGFGSFLCAPCEREAWDEFAVLKAQHAEMLRKGVHPKIASARMLVEVENG